MVNICAAKRKRLEIENLSSINPIIEIGIEKKGIKKF